MPALCLLALFFAKYQNYQILLRSLEGAEPALLQNNKLYTHSTDGGPLIPSGLLKMVPSDSLENEPFIYILKVNKWVIEHKIS